MIAYPFYQYRFGAFFDHVISPFTPGQFAGIIRQHNDCIDR